MVCTSFQYGHSKADFDGIGLEPVGDRTLDEAGVRLDLGQLDGLVLPARSDSKGGYGHGQDQSQGQNKYDNLFHKLLLYKFPRRRIVHGIEIGVGQALVNAVIRPHHVFASLVNVMRSRGDFPR